MDTIVSRIYNDVIEGKKTDVESGVESALGNGVSPADILELGLISAMEEVGKRFESGEFFVPEMLIAARAMNAGLALLKPKLVESDIRARGKVVMGTVKGDLHDIGKNLVAMMLEGAGFEVVDIGADVSPEKFVEAVWDEKPNLVGLSALLTTTMQNMQATIEALKMAGVRDQVKVIIGGAPLTEAYAQSIGADGYAPDASQAVSLVKNLV
jgi:5-methyltetrahydrofolate--homocysteine methyltransferase